MSHTGDEDELVPSSRSSGEYRLAVIGTSDFSATRAFESEESMQQISVSVGFPTIESITDIVKMGPQFQRRQVTFAIDDHNESDIDPNEVQMREELHDLLDAQQSGTAFILGHSHVKAKQGSGVGKRLAINFAYNFLRRNCRGPDVVLKVPPASLLEVGMVYIV